MDSPGHCEDPPLRSRFRPLDRLGRLGSLPWISYLMLLLLQLKVLWGIQHRDLAVGDESGYYSRAFLWFKDFSVDIVWSPLYTSFLGTLMHISTDAYVVTTLHRLILVFVADVMILALMRRLLPRWIAWLVAAWWAILPIAFDTVSTVHLFAVIPVVAAWLLILHGPSPWARGGAIAVLAVTTILVRNEYFLAMATLAGVCVWWETRVARQEVHESERRPVSYLLGYGVPLLMAAAVVLCFYARTIHQFPDVWTGAPLRNFPPPWAVHSGLKPKHTINMCQVYAVGYQQRHPEWDKDPMLDCVALMESTFGEPTPSLLDMLRRDPVAVLDHFWWNLSLTPSGIQLLLFNASAGAVNPDYFPVQLHSLRALVLSLITGSVLTLGLFLLYRDRRFWWEHWLKDRALGWLAMLSVVPVAGLIIPTQRPRPAYLFCHGIVLMALTGMCLFAIIHRFGGLPRLSGWLPIVMVTVLLVVPQHYPSEGSARPLLALYRRLAPFEAVFNRPDTVFLVSRNPLEIHGYVGHNYFTSPLLNFDYTILDGAAADRPLPLFLDQRGITLFYVDEGLWQKLSANPTHRAFLTAPESAGWKILAGQPAGAGRWMLLRKETAEPSGRGHPTR
jgi:hypothetical protein